MKMLKVLKKNASRVALVLALALPAVMGAPSAQAEDLKFFIPLPLTGALSVTGQAQQVGWMHAVDWINNKQGGIRGRKIDISFYDDEYKVELGVGAFKKAASSGDLIFTSANGTPVVRAISPTNNDLYKVLMASAGFASDLVDVEKYKYLFVPGPNYSDQVVMLLNYIKSHQKGDTAPRVAYVHSASEFGRDPIESMQKQAKKLGIEIVLVQETKWVEVDVTAHAIQVRNSRPDYVIFHGYAANVWPEMIKTLREYGVKTQFMGTMYGSHPDVVSTVGDAANDYIGAVPLNLLVADSKLPMMPIINDYLKTWKEKPYTGYANIGYMQSWGAAMILNEVIGRAIDKGVALNGENLIKEVASLNGWDSGGVYGIPVSFEKQRIPYGVLLRYTFKDNKLTVAEEEPWTKINW